MAPDVLDDECGSPRQPAEAARIGSGPDLVEARMRLIRGD